MKKLLLALSASLLLIGAGCASQTTTQTDLTTDGADEYQVPPPSEGAAAGTGADVNVDVGAGAGGVDADAHADLSADVAITAGGTFSPAVLTVKPGTTVTWKNTGSAKVWVASDPHPTHNGYPGFDSKAPVESGMTYAFTFEKKGSWGYHNHFNPTMQGTVVVE